MSALAALCGAGVGLGVVLVIAGWRGVDLPRPTRRLDRRKVERANLRIGLAVGAGGRGRSGHRLAGGRRVGRPGRLGRPGALGRRQAPPGGSGPYRGGRRVGGDAARHHGRLGRPGAGHHRHRPPRTVADPGRGRHPRRPPRRRAAGAGPAGLRRRGGRPDLRSGRRRPGPGGRAPSPTARGAARLAGRRGPGPGHHAASGGGWPGPDSHVGQGHRRCHRRARGRPGAVQPRLPRPLRHRHRPARPRLGGRGVCDGVRLALPHDPAGRGGPVPHRTPRVHVARTAPRGSSDDRSLSSAAPGSAPACG